MKRFASFGEIILLLIIAIPSFISLLNPSYFSMHDDQHIVRLFLLDQGIHQGVLYPRWVGGLGFGFGYPLFNFYPPLVYYIAEIFHLVGFSLIWSVKLTFILGYVLATAGMYLYAKRFVGKTGGFLSAVLYNYFFYHAVNGYVRGALAEFFTFSTLPFVLFSLDCLFKNLNKKNIIFFGICFAILVLNHPLIAFPFLIFLGLFFLFYVLMIKDKKKFIVSFLFAVILGLGLSSFFWLPSYVERKYTLVDTILTHELADYKIHYVYPDQFYYSPWGYAGSAPGHADGMTLQLGKPQIFGALFSLFVFLLYLLKKRKTGQSERYYILFVCLLLFSLFMSTQYSSFIWDRISYLSYLQFPWRFYAFAGIFISMLGGFGMMYVVKLITTFIRSRSLKKSLIIGFSLLVAIICAGVVLKYMRYFKPQRYLTLTDSAATTKEEISWRITRTSFEFSPKGVKTHIGKLGVTAIDIKHNELPQKPYEIIKGTGTVVVKKDLFVRKEFALDVREPMILRINTFYFPGWKVFLKSGTTITELKIDHANDYQLITVQVPKGMFTLVCSFTDTSIRTVSWIVTFVSFVAIGVLFLYKRSSI